ncbi:MAG: TolC family protein [Deltaproteobacteria bacterium]|nr:TolC family protein [Deltaproteobacteria bacterium]
MRTHALSWCAGVLAVWLGMPLASYAESPPPYPLGRGLPAFEAPAEPRESASVPIADPRGDLTLDAALAAALLGNANLAADAYEVRAREAALLQAHARPNPTLALELEDFAGSGEFRGARSAQTTLLLGQLVELGGKRAARVRTADADLEAAAWDYELRRIDVLARTAGAFAAVLTAQERLRLADESVALAKETQRVAGLRMRAGIASAAEEIRAGVSVEIAAVEREHTEHELETARQTLASMWGGEEARFERAQGDLEVLPEVPSEDSLALRLGEAPGVARWQAERARRDAQLAQARSARAPDLTLHAGPRHLSGPGNTALVAGVSLPLPLWDRRRGAIAEAAQRAAKGAAEARAERVRAATEIATARVGLAAAAEEAELLRTRVIPGAERAVAALRDGYQRGRFALVEVLEAERARLDARTQHLNALAEAHRHARELERLTGAPLEVRS